MGKGTYLRVKLPIPPDLTHGRSPPFGELAAILSMEHSIAPVPLWQFARQHRIYWPRESPKEERQRLYRPLRLLHEREDEPLAAGIPMA